MGIINMRLVGLAVLWLVLACFAEGNGGNNHATKFRGVSSLIETDQATLDKLVPKQYQTSNILDVVIGTWVRDDGSTYHHIFIQIPVKVKGKESSFMPINFMDDPKESEAATKNQAMTTQAAEFQINHYNNKAFYKVTSNGKTLATADYMMEGEETVPLVGEKSMFASLPAKGKPIPFQITDYKQTKQILLRGALSLDTLPGVKKMFIPVLATKRAIYFEADMNVLPATR